MTLRKNNDIIILENLNSGGDEMGFDYGKLLGRMKEMQTTQKMLAKKIHNTTSTLNQKLNNKGVFRQTEIFEICLCLEIPISEIGSYFFIQKVQKN